MNTCIYYLNNFCQVLGTLSILDWIHDTPYPIPVNMAWSLGFTTLHFLWDLYKGNKR